MAARNSRRSNKNATTRRTFLKQAGVAAFAAAVGPTILKATDKAGTKTPVLGMGEFKYEVTHGWGPLPSHIVWGETHGVTIDEAGLVYIKHRSHAPQPIDAVAIFDADGKFVHSFGKEY